MEITRAEAAAALADARAMLDRTRKGLFATGGSELLMLWGLVWIGAFVACHVAPQWAFVHWGIGNAVGFVGMAMIYLRFRGTPTRSEAMSRTGWRIGAFWGALCAYSWIWMFVAAPQHGIQLNALLCTMIMFAFVVMGLWLDVPLMLVLGIFITAATVVAYFVLPLSWYNLWMAAFGGGTMFAAGVYTFARWRT